MNAENSAETATRSRGRPFAPGTSGNPGGRPKANAAFRARARAEVDEHVIEAWAAEVRDRGPHWVRCSELLVAYAYGKPTNADDTEAEATTTNASIFEVLLPLLSKEEVVAIARNEPHPLTTWLESKDIE